MRAARRRGPGGGDAAGESHAPIGFERGRWRFEQFLAESDIARAEVGEGNKEAGGERVLELAPRTSFNRAADDAKHDAAGQQERSLYFFLRRRHRSRSRPTRLSLASSLIPLSR